MIHSGIKPFKCNIWGSSFTQNGALKIHKKINLDENSFKCNVCEKAFTQYHNLQIRERIHSGKRPFPCSE